VTGLLLDSKSPAPCVSRNLIYRRPPPPTGLESRPSLQILNIGLLSDRYQSTHLFSSLLLYVTQYSSPCLDKVTRTRPQLLLRGRWPTMAPAVPLAVLQTPTRTGLRFPTWLSAGAFRIALLNATTVSYFCPQFPTLQDRARMPVRGQRTNIHFRQETQETPGRPRTQGRIIISIPTRSSRTAQATSCQEAADK